MEVSWSSGSRTVLLMKWFGVQALLMAPITLSGAFNLYLLLSTQVNGWVAIRIQNVSQFDLACVYLSKWLHGCNAPQGVEKVH